MKRGRKPFRKIMNKTCFYCNSIFNTLDERKIYCDRQCFTKSGVGGFQKGHVRLSLGSTGKHWNLSDETRAKQSVAQSKEKNPAWRGGLTEKSYSFYVSPEYKKWRKQIIGRDKKCGWCGSKERLEADHIAPRFLYPELRFVIENGRTLCHDCHTKTETYRGGNRKLLRSEKGQFVANLYIPKIT